MYRKIIAVTAVALYTLLAFLAAVVTDFHDRYNPQSIGVNAKLIVDFSQSQISDADALVALQELDSDGGLGLFKLAPDLDSAGGQVFVDLSADSAAQTVGWFGNYAPAQIVGVERLANSSPDGTYLVTGEGDLDGAVDSLTERGVIVDRVDVSTLDSILNLSQQAGFAAPVLAACALVAAITVFWLAIKARSRALRVLAGAAPWRIQAQDLGVLVITLLTTAVGVAAVASCLVGLTRGWTYVPVFLSIAATFEGATLAASVLVALLLSASSWPSVEVIARRLPAVKSLRWAARVVQIGTLITLIAFAGPAWAAAADAQRTAVQLDAWNELSDQVMLSFDIPDEDMDTVAPQVDRIVGSAESDGEAALSYAITEEQWAGDFGEYDAIALVNRQWISLMERALGPDALRPVAPDALNVMLSRELGPSLELWSRGGTEARGVDDLRAFEPATDAPFPVINGGAAGQLTFSSDVLVLEVPRISAFFDAPNIVSLASTGNIVFTGVASTQNRLDAEKLTPDGLAELGIEGTIRPLYVAEQGILEAQFAAYLSQLLAISLAALTIAFLVASAVTAMISGLINARRDFPLRLTGSTWAEVVRSRALLDVGMGTVIAIVIIAIQPVSTMAVTALASAFAIIAIYGSHLIAARAVFDRVVHRKL
ncbi:hypothetical protein JSY14_06000 [Brachybacterium sp. EF45031]|uniref:hypothetical protein n=1 Tax=Brachybacterium sillae TaxID=2810536 RepID=UPI00217E235B|nr:hypothetical protein [Brachybacterium sillae]MCS6711599.1 hypothetical protein [Brachybacterium sillae]